MNAPKIHFKRVKLTAQQRRLWEDTLAALSWIAPGFTHVLYTMLHNSGDDDVALFTQELEYTAGTDGYQLAFNPDRFFKYSLMERVFVVLHEIMHEILGHVHAGWKFRQAGKITVAGKSLPFAPKYANYMQDYVINAILIASKMGKFSEDWLHDPDYATDKDQWIEVYFKHWQHPPPPTRPGEGASDIELRDPRNNPGRMDDHMNPHETRGIEPHEAPERNDVQWDIVVKAAMEIQEAQGKLPPSLKMFFQEVLRPKVDWTDHVRGLLLRIAGSGAYDWRKLDRRLVTRGIGSPGTTGHGAGLLVVGGDSSGSVFQDPSLIARWIGEVGGMVEDVQPEETHVVWCDTKVKRVDICRDANDVRKMIYDGVPGGGGTDFMPVFKYIEDNGLVPDALIYLTDGYGKFPKHAPDFPVIWGDISHGAVAYPFGTVVQIPTSADTDD